MDSRAVSTSPNKPIETVLTDQIKKSAQESKKPTSPSAGVLASKDKVDVGMGQLYKSLTVLADNILAKLDEMLKNELPEGIVSLKPEEHTPEATAQRIADGSTALLSVFAKKHPELEGRELLEKFMAEIRSGIKRGYNEAAAILGDLGAFQFKGVKEGIEETMKLVEEKLLVFEHDYLEKHGLNSEQTQESKGEDAKEQAS